MNTRKIILMTQLALYERKYGKKDLEKSNFYKQDYIYLRSMWTRLFAVLGAVILIFIYCFLRIGSLGLEETVTFIKNNYKNFAYFIIFVFLVYTVIGKIIYSKEFNRSEKRKEQETNGIYNQNKEECKKQRKSRREEIYKWQR